VPAAPLSPSPAEATAGTPTQTLGSRHREGVLNDPCVQSLTSPKPPSTSCTQSGGEECAAAPAAALPKHVAAINCGRDAELSQKAAWPGSSEKKRAKRNSTRVEKTLGLKCLRKG
jgi:hypothetical protein